MSRSKMVTPLWSFTVKCRWVTSASPANENHWVVVPACGRSAEPLAL